MAARSRSPTRSSRSRSSPTSWRRPTTRRIRSSAGSSSTRASSRQGSTGGCSPSPSSTRARSTWPSTCTPCTWSGPVVERIYGWKLYIFVYLACDLAASVASFVFGDPLIGSVGASGAIFGLFGCLFVAGRLHNPILDRQSRGLAAQIGTLIVLNLVIGFTRRSGHDRQLRPPRRPARRRLARLRPGPAGRPDAGQRLGAHERPAPAHRSAGRDIAARAGRRRPARAVRRRGDRGQRSFEVRRAPVARSGGVVAYRRLAGPGAGGRSPARRAARGSRPAPRRRGPGPARARSPGPRPLLVPLRAGSPRKKRSKIRSVPPGGKPGPSSLTSRVIQSVEPRTSSQTWPPGEGTTARAFSIRLPRIRSTATRSALKPRSGTGPAGAGVRPRPARPVAGPLLR